MVDMIILGQCAAVFASMIVLNQLTFGIVGDSVLDKLNELRRKHKKRSLTFFRKPWCISYRIPNLSWFLLGITLMVILNSPILHWWIKGGILLVHPLSLIYRVYFTQPDLSLIRESLKGFPLEGPLGAILKEDK